MKPDAKIRLKLPRQDLASPAAFDPSADAARRWAAQLPVAEPAIVAHRLAIAIDELNRCPMPPELRFDVLSALQANLRIAGASLSRRFLNQPLVMPEEPHRLARLVDQLHSLNVTGFSQCAADILRDPNRIRDRNPARLLCQALLAAMDYCGRKLLLRQQLHLPPEPGDWLAMHQLYAIAERQDVAGIALPLRDGGNASIEQSYLVAMLLACCKPNQLRQADLALVYQAFREWQQHLRLRPFDGGDSLFQVNLEEDVPPLYAALHPGRDPDQLRRIDCGGMVAFMTSLQAMHRGKKGIALASGDLLPPGVLSHLLDTLGSVQVRNFERKPNGGELAVSFGLGAAHFHARASQQPAGHAVAGDYPVYRMRAVNGSPGGYCVEWTGVLPVEVRSGQLVSLQEAAGKRWMVAVVRWISQLEARQTLIGLELLSPGAQAYMAVARRKLGDASEAQRVLLLPEIRLVGHPASLVTPRAGFAEQQKYSLQRDGQQLEVQLLRQMATTSSHSQFEFRYLPADAGVTGARPRRYDSIWSRI